MHQGTTLLFLSAFRVCFGFGAPFFFFVFVVFLPCASDRRLARCMSPPFWLVCFCFSVWLLGWLFVCWSLLSLSLALMVPPCLDCCSTLSPLQSFPHWCSLLSLFAWLIGVLLLFLCPPLSLSDEWMIIRCNFGRPEPWTGLCCSEQHWCSRRALCGTIWGALVQQRLLTWHSQGCPFSVWTLFLLNGRVKCHYWRLSWIRLYFSTTMHCRSIRDEDTLAAPEQFGGEYVLHSSLLAAFLSVDLWWAASSWTFSFPSQREEYWAAWRIQHSWLLLHA